LTSPRPLSKIQPSRLLYQKLVESDRVLYLSHVSHDAVRRYITGKGLTQVQAVQRFEDSLAFSQKRAYFGIFSVYLKNPKTYIGLARMKLENDGSIKIGYNLLKNISDKTSGLKWQKPF
jgi:hypothetical protein